MVIFEVELAIATKIKNSRFQMGQELQPYPSQPTTGITKRCHRNQVDYDNGGGGAECSGKSCQSCMARVIADCVAVCCCPCAVVNFFTLTFVKLPWIMGKKCLSNLSKKNTNKKKLKNGDKNVISRKEQGENEELEKVTAIEEVDETGSNKYSTRFEAERVWLEMYKADHLGFGRVSFNGIQSLV